MAPEKKIAEAFGTPVFIHDATRIALNYSIVHGMFEGAAEFFYSIKANPNTFIADSLCRMGAGAEVSSLTEMELARRAGFPLRDIIFAGRGNDSRHFRSATSPATSAACALSTL
ncbi:MAG TPA: hypothetical protein VEC01_17705 [Noviherbaspirillum sp.]|uniref:hypothetical protein n=1 Tax=Noviherbaspirillum sp. TaxID=1926288 RepID=UPI002D4C6285|nr:hypothetical protein [Noviherbaspirillum sp.]HYD97166.1 hypothetical protein [Noviherbaspirillum sp.]